MQARVRHHLLPAVIGICLAATLSAADISGKWHFVWDTEGGIRHTEWAITQNGEALKIVIQDGQPLNGKLEGDRMTVEGRLNSHEAGYSATLKVVGELKDGKLSGRGSWDQYGMTFTATRAD